MATSQGIYAQTPTMQYWYNRFEDGESLDDLTGRLQNLYNKMIAENSESDNPTLENKVKEWFKTTITEAIQAKQAYYANTVTGQISSFFQWVAATFFGCAGSEYVTPLQHANSFLQLVQHIDEIQYLNDCNPQDPPKNEFFHPSFLEVSLFCELHQPEMLEISKSENSGVCLKVPGKTDTSFYVMPDGNCYLVCIDPTVSSRLVDPNYIASGATKEVYRAYDFMNKKTVAFMRSLEDADPAYPNNCSLVKNEYAALKRFDRVSGILQVRNRFVQNGRACFFSDYYYEKSLFHFLHPQRREPIQLSSKQEQHLIVKILEGAEEIHKRGYLHRDLKDANILIKQVKDPDNQYDVLYDPTIIDFECCCEKDDRRSLEKGASSPNFWAPEYAREMLNSLQSKTSSLADVSTEQMDVWALGVVLYHIHYRKETPWEPYGPGAPKRLADLKDDWFKPQDDDKIGQVIKGMLQVDPSKRMSLAKARLQLEKIKTELD